MRTPITTVEDVKQLGTILCVWAHPDDETFRCAGIMAAAIRNGQKVACLTATKGEAGVQDSSIWPAELLGDIRAAEMKKALNCIGCQNHHWLGYPDGECDEVSDMEGAAKVREFIDEYEPNSILTFGPEGWSGHTDHQAVSRWATQAAGSETHVYYSVEDKELYEKHLIEADKQFHFYFNIDKPPARQASECDIAFRLSGELCQIKEEALRSMPSQTKLLLDNLSEDFIRTAFCVECFIQADPH